MKKVATLVVLGLVSAAVLSGCCCKKRCCKPVCHTPCQEKCVERITKEYGCK